MFELVAKLIDEIDYDFVKDCNLRDFLENNPLGSVIDIEEEPKIKWYQLYLPKDKAALFLEIEACLPKEAQEELQKLMEEKNTPQLFSKTKSWPYRARWINLNCEGDQDYLVT